GLPVTAVDFTPSSFLGVGAVQKVSLFDLNKPNDPVFCDDRLQNVAISALKCISDNEFYTANQSGQLVFYDKRSSLRPLFGKLLQKFSGLQISQHPTTSNSLLIIYDNGKILCWDRINTKASLYSEHPTYHAKTIRHSKWSDTPLSVLGYYEGEIKQLSTEYSCNSDKDLFSFNVFDEILYENVKAQNYFNSLQNNSYFKYNTMALNCLTILPSNMLVVGVYLENTDKSFLGLVDPFAKSGERIVCLSPLQNKPALCTEASKEKLIYTGTLSGQSKIFVRHFNELVRVQDVVEDYQSTIDVTVSQF
ncbi:MAG: hypothetical protein MHPSP_003271, partial [Paramarteilia canceri]